jgi:hypothetical protein
LVDEGFASAGVDVEGVGLAAVGGQSAHELAGEVFVEGFGGDGRDEFGDQFGVPAAVEADVDAVGEDLVAALDETESLSRQVLTGQAGEWFTVEEVESTLIGSRGGIEIATIAMPRRRTDSSFELGDVQRLVRQPQHVAIRRTVEDVGGEGTAKPIDVWR